MRATPFKWLLIALMVVSFAGRPWAQTSPESTEGCGGLNAVAMESANSAAANGVGKIASSETATPTPDSAKPMVGDCVKTCAAAPILGISAMAWAPDAWPQTHSAAIEVALKGHPPEPELFPPIALV